MQATEICITWGAIVLATITTILISSFLKAWIGSLLLLVLILIITPTFFQKKKLKMFLQ